MTGVRWATFLVGIWFAGSLFVSLVAAENFYTIDRLLSQRRDSTRRLAARVHGQPRATSAVCAVC